MPAILLMAAPFACCFALSRYRAIALTLRVRLAFAAAHSKAPRNASKWLTVEQARYIVSPSKFPN
jgi:hypothetical protein